MIEAEKKRQEAEEQARLLKEQQEAEEREKEEAEKQVDQTEQRSRHDLGKDIVDEGNRTKPLVGTVS